MSYISVTDDNTKANAINAKLELQAMSDRIISQIDPFLFTDFSLAIEQKYLLEITNSLTGNASSYKLRDALIDIDDFASNALLLLKLEVEKDGVMETLDFNISSIDASTSAGSLENPKYYIYCDNSDKIGFRFWFKLNN